MGISAGRLSLKSSRSLWLSLKLFCNYNNYTYSLKDLRQYLGLRYNKTKSQTQKPLQANHLKLGKYVLYHYLLFYFNHCRSLLFILRQNCISHLKYIACKTTATAFLLPASQENAKTTFAIIYRVPDNVHTGCHTTFYSPVHVLTGCPVKT